MPNTERFTGRVAAYIAYRERYDPQIVLPVLRKWCGLNPHWTVADVGAGTGMLSDVFLHNGNQVIAVEPNAQMRDACARLHPGTPRLTIVDGTAESTTLSDSSVDAVAVGRALHWFDLDAALREFRRILKADGWLVAVSLGRDRDGREENLRLEEFLRPYTAHGEGTRVTGVYQQLRGFFRDGEFHHQEVVGEMSLDWEAFRGLILSLSHAPLPDSPQFTSFGAGLLRFFSAYQKEGKVSLNTRYWINAARFL